MSRVGVVATGIVAAAVSLAVAGVAHADDAATPQPPAPAPVPAQAGSGVSHGDEAATPQTPPPAPMPPQAGPHPLLAGTHLAGFLQLPVQSFPQPTLAAMITVDAFLLGIGANFTYNGNGNVNGASPATTDKFAFGSVVYGSYAVINRAPFFLHPEVAWITSWAPGSAFTQMNIVAPGLGFGFAPWAAPIILDAAWDVNFIFVNGAKPVIASSPALRIGFLLF
jgi:hypothetical protein